MKATSPLPELTLPQMLREQAQKKPDKLALRQKDFGIWIPYTWAEYYRLARRFGMALLSIGVGPGGKMGILSENKAEWVISQMGAGIISAVTVGVYPTSPTPEVAYVVGHADVEVIVCEDQEQADKILDAIDQLPKIRKIIVIDMRGLRDYKSELLISFEAFEQLGASFESKNEGLTDAMLDKQQLANEGEAAKRSSGLARPQKKGPSLRAPSAKKRSSRGCLHYASASFEGNPCWPIAD